MTSPHENNSPEKQKKTSTKSGEWFRHDYHSRNDKKISQLRMLHGARGYGLYLMIVEMIYENGGGLDLQSPTDLKALEWELREENIGQFINDLVEIGLLRDCTDGHGIYVSSRALEELSFRTSSKVKSIEAGKKGAARRWEGYEEEMAGPLVENGVAIIENGTRQDSTNSTVHTLQTIQTTQESIGAQVAPPALESKVEKPKKAEKPVVPPFTHVRMSPEEVARFKAEYPDKAMREYYYQSVDDYLDNNPKKRGRDCNRTLRAFIRSDKAAQKGWFTPKRGPYVNERPGRQPFSPNGTEKELLSIYARQGKPNGIP